jgi:hypothetical protein
MSLKGRVFRSINAILARADMELRMVSRDFDARLDQPAHLQRMFSALGKAGEEWLKQQQLFPVRCQFDAARGIAEFYEKYLDSPFRSKEGGSRFNNLVWLYLIARAMKPEFVIDSGTFRGASAWGFSCAGCQVYSFDIDLSHLACRAENVVYSECDWASYAWQDLSNSLIYFDDHLDQVRRLMEASQRNIPLAIFDDDFPFTSFPPMANQGYALPKLEFVLDPELRESKEISWINHGRRSVFPIDRSYLDHALTLMAETQRLPDTSPVTGIQQLPYRIVKIH